MSRPNAFLLNGMVSFWMVQRGLLWFIVVYCGVVWYRIVRYCVDRRSSISPSPIDWCILYGANTLSYTQTKPGFRKLNMDEIKTPIQTEKHIKQITRRRTRLPCNDAGVFVVIAIVVVPVAAAHRNHQQTQQRKGTQRTMPFTTPNVVLCKHQPLSGWI